MAPPPQFFAQVLFNGRKWDGLTHEVCVLEEEYCHQRATFLLETDRSDRVFFSDGTPVLLRWGSDRRMREFIGYVNHVEPMQSPKSAKNDDYVKVYCVGPTWVLNESDFLTFRNVDVTALVRSIGDQFRFNTSSVQRHDRLWPALHQSGDSYWKFMCDSLKKVGYTLFPRGMDLHALDQRAAVRDFKYSPPILSPKRLNGNVYKFQAEHGATSPNGGTLASRDIFSVDPRSGRVVSIRNRANSEKPVFNRSAHTPVFRAGATDITFSDLAEGAVKLAGAEKKNRFSVMATVEGSSNPRVQVGSVVDVYGMGGKNDGLWYVSKAEHRYMLQGKTEMSLTLLRDSAEPSRNVVARPFDNGIARPKAARLVSGQWVL